MGGLAFASGQLGLAALKTPRMPPRVYEAVLKKLHAQLRDKYSAVATPIPGPAKTSYGDIDIHLTWEKQVGPNPRPPYKDLADHIGAVRFIKQRGSDSAAMAIPWPRELVPEDQGEEDLYIQVDIHLCPTIERLQWSVFRYAHGDLWSMVGSIMRPLGLTIDDVGLYVRNPDIEEQDRPKSKVLLTKEPAEILSFLGLPFDGTQWEEPFATEQALFEYVESADIFTLAMSAGVYSGNIPASIVRIHTKDGRRMNMRPVYRNWLETFVPAALATGKYPKIYTYHEMRRFILDRAFDRFPWARGVYLAKMKDWMIESQRARIWGVIQDLVPADTSKELRGHALSALRKLVLKGERLGDIEPPENLQDQATGLFYQNRVRHFVLSSWETVAQASKSIAQKKYEESRRDKAPALQAVGT